MCDPEALNQQLHELLLTQRSIELALLDLDAKVTRLVEPPDA